MSDDYSLASISNEPVPNRGTPRSNPPPLGSLASASRRAGLEQLSTQLDELKSWLAADLAAIETELDEIGRAHEGDLAQRAAAHLLGRRGKRIRPICVLIGARLAAAQDGAATRDVAVASELVHAATLLHDDVIDDGDERRGAPAARVVFGNSASILAGDYLLIEALERVRRLQNAELLGELLGTIAQMVAAEALQLERRGTLDPGRELYFRIIDGKTASLFRWALDSGARMGTMGDRQRLALAEVGTALGRAFQLIDDALDLEGEAELVGKDLFKDLAQGKLSWPMIVAVERDPSILVAIRELGGDEPTAARTRVLVERIRNLGGVDAARARAREHARAARAALELLPPGTARATLAHVVEAAVSRRA